MDEIDEAQQYQEVYLAAAQWRATQPREAPLLIHGNRHCTDCELPIPEARIMANPQAVRCIGCQTIKEGQRL